MRNAETFDEIFDRPGSVETTFCPFPPAVGRQEIVEPPRKSETMPHPRTEPSTSIVSFASGTVKLANIESKMKVSVECRDGLPIRFQLGQQVRVVEELLDRWYGTRDAYFKVRAYDGDLYILRKDESTPEEAWGLESFTAIRTETEGRGPTHMLPA